MPDSFELAIKNITIVGENLDPSSLTQHWFVISGIVQESEFLENSIFTTSFCQIFTERFTLILFANQLHFSFKGETDDEELITAVLSKCLGRMAQSNFKSIGCNFIYFAPFLDSSGENLTKSLFYNSENKLYRLFDEGKENSDVSYGAYMSKDYESTRLKLDIKPSIVENSKGESLSVISYSFNFHKDLVKDTGYEHILSSFGKWSMFRKYSNSLLTNFYNKAN